MKIRSAQKKKSAQEGIIPTSQVGKERIRGVQQLIHRLR